MLAKMLFRTALSLGMLAQFTPARAAGENAVAQFYRGRQVTLYIGSAVGGGYDSYGRLIARYIGKHIPGDPSVVPVNMPGASGMTLVSHLLTSAPTDGTSLAIIQPNDVMASLLTDKTAAPFQAQRLIYLGSAEMEDAICWVRSDAETLSFKDLFSKSLLIGASAPGGNSYDLPNLENNILKTQFKVVTGYAGVNEVLLAVDRNEVHGVCGTGAAALLTQRPHWLDSGFAKMLVQESAVGNPKLNAAGVPRTIDFAKTPEDRLALRLVYAQQEFGRPFVTTPGTPADRAAALRRAFNQTLADKDLLREAARLHLDIEEMSGEQLQKLVADLYATPPSVVARAKKALAPASTRSPNTERVSK